MPHGIGERYLVTGHDRDLRIRDEAAGTAIHHIHALRLEQLCHRDAVADLPAAFHPIDRRDAHGERQVFRPEPSTCTARVVSSNMRMRFSKLPPYLSVR